MCPWHAPRGWRQRRKPRDHAIGAVEAAAEGLAVEVRTCHHGERVRPGEFENAKHVADGIDDRLHAEVVEALAQPGARA